MSGAAITGDGRDGDAADWSQVTAGPFLAATLKALRGPDGADVDPGPAFKGTLRPYQKAGVQWMQLLSGLGLGACLADDMGLGKTIQVLSLLQVLGRKETGRQPRRQIDMQSSGTRSPIASRPLFTSCLPNKPVSRSAMKRWMCSPNSCKPRY